LVKSIFEDVIVFEPTVAVGRVPYSRGVITVYTTGFVIAAVIAICPINTVCLV
jgi:hypothetical protein